MSESNENETSSDYENNDEEYDGPEVQVVTEEDHLLPKGEYFSAAFALGSLNSRVSVFDDEDYDEEEEQEEEHAPVEKSFDPEEREPVVLKEEKAVEASILGNEDQMDSGDVQEVSKNDFGVSDNDGRNLAIPPLADELLLKCDRLLDEYRHELTEAERGIASRDSLR